MASSQSNMLASLGKLTELKQRLLFVVGALIVFRLGSFIPIPGVNPDEMARRVQQGGGLLDMFNMFSGGALSRLSVFALSVMPYISASIIVQMFASVIPGVAGAAQGRRGRPAQADDVHALRYGRARGVPVVRRRQHAAEPGRHRLRAGPELRVHDGGRPHRRHAVPDVARRADHRARHRQRHFAADLRRHRRRSSGGGRAYARHGADRRAADPARADRVHDRARGDRVRRLHGARPAPDHGELRAGARAAPARRT